MIAAIVMQKVQRSDVYHNILPVLAITGILGIKYVGFWLAGALLGIALRPTSEG